MRRWLAGLVDVEVQRLVDELAHVRRTRQQALRTALDQHAEVQRLRARNEQLESLLLDPSTIKEQ